MSQETIYEQSLDVHERLKGKLETVPKMPLTSMNDLSLLYTPGVAEPCRAIAKDPSEVYRYTGKGNTVAVVTDGTAVLGLGNIGPKAALPVMEGKAYLFKSFADIDSYPICLDTTDPQEIIKIVQAIAPSFGGINLEDIAAPNCVIIEKELRKTLDIPVFHDDQHGTAIVVTAALFNAVKIVHKDIAELTVVVSGAGAAGSSIIKMLHNLGVKEIYAFDINGIITKSKYRDYNFVNKELCYITNSQCKDFSMAEAMKEADVFVGVSAPNLVTPEMVASMKRDPILFAMANPEPEIPYNLGKSAGARVMATGRSDSPNQVNNVLAFPGIFRGTFDSGTTTITEKMKIAAARAIASLVSEEELCEEYIIPQALNKRVAQTVADAVAQQAQKEGLARI